MNPLGAYPLRNGGCRFTVWAPLKERMNLHLVHPVEKIFPMIKNEEGYFELEIDHIGPGSRYFFQPEGERDLPDPASHHQPEGVHGPSEVVDHGSYPWQDQHWKGIPFHELVLYELHVGTF